MKAQFAATLPINPASTEPKLTQAQVWEGLTFKARQPMGFVPVETCAVVEDRGEDGITRRVKFLPGVLPIDSEVTEVVTYNKPLKVEFHMLERLLDVSNIISVGLNDDLYLTFAFVMELPDTPENAAPEKLWGMARGATQKSIDVIRQMVVDGKL